MVAYARGSIPRDSHPSLEGSQLAAGCTSSCLVCRWEASIFILLFSCVLLLFPAVTSCCHELLAGLLLRD